MRVESNSDKTKPTLPSTEYKTKLLSGTSVVEVGTGAAGIADVEPPCGGSNGVEATWTKTGTGTGTGTGAWTGICNGGG